MSWSSWETRRRHAVTWGRHAFGTTPSRDARRLACAWLAAHDCDGEVIACAGLVVAELAANSAEHGGRLDALCLDVFPSEPRAPGSLIVGVYDLGRDHPFHAGGRRLPGEGLRERGRGLGIVAALSLECGAARLHDGHQHVWCRLAVPPRKAAGPGGGPGVHGGG
ncbi:ATP-binding protein [Kitasatospora sp. NPDC059408]|uniref:ATP-binding protein n=2 Tax=unclassified Kitasatospora TaxID=2633591 RepID=UPI0036C5D636